MKSKLPHVGTTIFTLMSKLAVETGAINLGQGFPNFAIDPKLADLVHKYILEGYNQYAPLAGVQPLREAISDKISNTNGFRYDPETEITVTAGATQAIFTAIQALVFDRDEVILFAPAYDCYAPAIELCGGKPVWIELKYPDYKVDWDQVKKVINHRTRMIVINTPHNPSGTCLGTDDLKQLEKIVAGSDIVVLSDEVYEHIIFDDLVHESVTRYSQLASQSLIVASFGKTFHCTGWKLGYIAGPARLMTEFRKVHQFNVFVCNTPVQYAIAEYMQDKSTYLGLPAFYQRKRDYLLQKIQGSRFSYRPSSGTYFQSLCYHGISDEPDTDFAMHMTRELGLAAIPCSVFYQDRLDEKVLRFCFAKDDETLEKAAAILRQI